METKYYFCDGNQLQLDNIITSDTIPLVYREYHELDGTISFHNGVKDSCTCWSTGKYIRKQKDKMEPKKMFVYQLTLEGGHQFEYTFEGGITLNHKDDNGVELQSLITSAVFVKSFEEEEPTIVVESESVESELVG